MSTAHPVVITAAGLGSRLGLNRPKCLVEIEGEPLIHHQLRALQDCQDVRVVVGFQERDVIRVAREMREDLIFVRNARYRTTSNLQSLALGTLGQTGPFISLDGDVLVSASEFKRFLAAARNQSQLVAITQRTTDEAVSVALSALNTQVISFHVPARPQDNFEWSGLALINQVDSATRGFVFRQIERELPSPFLEIECYEIDTEDDLARARMHASKYLKGS